ncbi:DUF2306 domain-containing protein [uncultured Polaribacter sp.]|uniref:DUF2306 domain-containing protein n=1 Tax=uncultured Polaribacter sp. TaxID=174711 RepID=UPI00261346F1|nr:DUF2306 domain-containing protein [uncultured Polaribacter sp.]
MNFNYLMFAHLITVLPCVLIGALLLLIKKGTKLHKNMGKLYMILMLITAFITLFMKAQVGPKFLNHFGWIHLFSVLTFYSIPTAFFAARKGDIKTHKRKMILLYFGAIVIAGAFTFYPGRYLHSLFFN